MKVLMESISASLPVEMIYSDFSTNPREVKQSSLSRNDVTERLLALKGILCNCGEVDADAFREILLSTRLFDSSKDIVEKFILEEF